MNVSLPTPWPLFPALAQYLLLVRTENLIGPTVEYAGYILPIYKNTVLNNFVGQYRA